MQRSLLLFENSLKTEATRKKYLYFLDNFKNFYKLKDYDSIIVIEVPQLQIMVEYCDDVKEEDWPKLYENIYGRNSDFL